MSDRACAAFLQWALPRVELRWAGFRRVRGQVCKRLKRRLKALGLEGFAEYRLRLERDPSEWQRLDEACRITISRFYRDRGVFGGLQDCVLPSLARKAGSDGRSLIRCWSAGCASGEEVYSLKIVWDLTLAARFPSLDLSIIGTDIDDIVLSRARAASYARSSLGELPEAFISQAFERRGELWNVRGVHRRGVTFLRQDLRQEAPAGPFDLVLCRNVAFTYFAPDLQRSVSARIATVLAPGGYLIIGAHEALTEDTLAFESHSGSHQIFRRPD
ncbi:MAG TPA: CheR family methyltransferase [Hyphomicrobiaceae bacterium]|nr:CheR family methyltransferase [Hyphomicrobiaceae bacterium]